MADKPKSEKQLKLNQNRAAAKNNITRRTGKPAKITNVMRLVALRREGRDEEEFFKTLMGAAGTAAAAAATAAAARGEPAAAAAVKAEADVMSAATGAASAKMAKYQQARTKAAQNLTELLKEHGKKPTVAAIAKLTSLRLDGKNNTTLLAAVRNAALAKSTAQGATTAKKIVKKAAESVTSNTTKRAAAQTNWASRLRAAAANLKAAGQTLKADPGMVSKFAAARKTRPNLTASNFMNEAGTKKKNNSTRRRSNMRIPYKGKKTYGTAAPRPMKPAGPFEGIYKPYAGSSNSPFESYPSPQFN